MLVIKQLLDNFVTDLTQRSMKNISFFCMMGPNFYGLHNDRCFRHQRLFLMPWDGIFFTLKDKDFFIAT